ncbi:hypothetical protein, partial [Streptomyces sp. URMC 123]|uniref:hypothetical protein n=1 Tax=Streptomyces sp. URMC 123 TaxID=3423403 RepID=UPI003F1B8EBE
MGAARSARPHRPHPPNSLIGAARPAVWRCRTADEADAAEATRRRGRHGDAAANAAADQVAPPRRPSTRSPAGATARPLTTGEPSALLTIFEVT